MLLLLRVWITTETSWLDLRYSWTVQLYRKKTMKHSGYPPGRLIHQCRGVFLSFFLIPFNQKIVHFPQFSEKILKKKTSGGKVIFIWAWGNEILGKKHPCNWLIDRFFYIIFVKNTLIICLKFCLIVSESRVWNQIYDGVSIFSVTWKLMF